MVFLPEHGAWAGAPGVIPLPVLTLLSTVTPFQTESTGNQGLWMFWGIWTLKED